MPAISLDNTITLAISARDRHRSAKWHSDVLGFNLLHHMNEAGWSEMATKTDGVTLGLGEQTEPSPGNTVPVFGWLTSVRIEQASKPPAFGSMGTPKPSKAWSALRRTTTRTATLS
jgi:hypothetical protein